VSGEDGQLLVRSVEHSLARRVPLVKTYLFYKENNSIELNIFFFWLSRILWRKVSVLLKYYNNGTKRQTVVR
jgi:hypothetical protein